MSLRIKKKDRVIVLAGKDKGKIGEVVQVFPKENRVVVSGINMMARHTKPSAKGNGGIVRREAPLDMSNVAIADPKDDKPTRIGVKTLDDGRKVRVAKRSGEVIDR